MILVVHDSYCVCVAYTYFVLIFVSKPSRSPLNNLPPAKYNHSNGFYDNRKITGAH